MWRRALTRAPGRAFPPPSTVRMISSGEKVTFHKVKIQPRVGIVRRVAFYGMVGAACYMVWDHITELPWRNFDPRPFPKEVLDPDEPVEPLFFPFPFTDKQVNPLPYAGAEEEWQSFIKFNSDKELRRRVKDDLTMLVKRAAEKNPVTRKWAKNGESFQLGPTWLIISFPERPPPEFVRTGLEVGGENGLEIKTKKVDPRIKVMIDRVLMPYPLASASYAFFKAMVQQNVSTVAKYLGYPSGGKDINTSNPNPEDIEKTLKKFRARQTAGGNTATNTSSDNTSRPSTASESGDTPAPKAGTNKYANYNAKDRPIAKENIPYHATLAASGPWAAFKETYKRTWKPLRSLPPRGSLAVHGMVRLDSPKGQVFIDVFAWYHPKTDDFHDNSLTMNLRAITPFNQKPRR